MVRLYRTFSIYIVAGKTRYAGCWNNKVLSRCCKDDTGPDSHSIVLDFDLIKNDQVRTYPYTVAQAHTAVLLCTLHLLSQCKLPPAYVECEKLT